MRAFRVALALAVVPIIWTYAFGVTAVVLLADLLVLPLLRRDPLPDVPARDRNASIIILNWNGADYLRKLLPTVKAAVARTPGDHEVLVVDNGSTDDSAAVVGDEHPWAQLVQLPANLGFSAGNRAGVRVARREILVFLNNDMRVEPDFLVQLLAPFGPGDLFAVTARIEVESGWEETGRTRADLARGKLYHVDSARGGDLVPVLWPGGGSSAFDRDKFVALGGFEDLYAPAYGEDVSLGYLAWRCGWRSLYAPGAVVHHLRQGTSARTRGERWIERMQRRNLELFYWRCVTSPALLLQRAARLPWDVLAGPGGAGVGLAAVGGALLRLPRAIWLRQRSRSRYRLSDREARRRACHVGAHRRVAVPARRQRPVVLAIGSRPTGPDLRHHAGDRIEVERVRVDVPDAAEPPVEDLFGMLPRRFWGAARGGAFRDRIRDLVQESDCDLVLFEDLRLVAAGAPYSAGTELLWWSELPAADGFLERVRLERLARRLVGRLTGLVTEDVPAARRLARRGLPVVEPAGFAALVLEVHHAGGSR